MPEGSGAIVVHRQLAQRIPGYEVLAYDPARSFLPPLISMVGRRRKADLIHTTPDYALFLARRGVPLVATFHNLVIDEYMRRYSSAAQRLHYRTDLRWFLNRAVRVSARMTAVSNFTAQLAREELGIDKEIAVIPNGVDTDRFSPCAASQKRRLRVLFAGNPTRRKGSEMLQPVADGLRDFADLVIAAGLRGNAARGPKGDNVEWLGRVSHDHMPSLYRTVDALLLPTVREGDSLVVLEAMSSGLPVVATDCSSLPERVAHGEGGFLCRPGAVAEFVAALERLRDPALRLRMGEFNRRRAIEDFPIARMVAAYEQVFASTLRH